ncbi:uncharacterized protein A4U43_C02F720 [Asparagus officinalis]|uniref:Uncharacterized protein n=1 Tax=Asparagus officinalis TaxID=4686 RepID=A0A5P1FJN3_ASPOF|nr:uncharacterized protein A4U43_C02F720 [Asparagus officinalis]
MDSKGASLVLLLLVSFHAHIFPSSEARPFPIINEERYVMVLQSLGMNCRCCDDRENGGECRSSWESKCRNLDCRPWKIL